MRFFFIVHASIEFGFHLWTPTHERVSVSWLSRTYLHQLCYVTCCNLEDLPEEMDDRDGETESQGNPYCHRELMLEIWPLDGTLKLRVKMNMEVMTMEEWSKCPQTFRSEVYP